MPALITHSGSVGVDGCNVEGGRSGLGHLGGGSVVSGAGDRRTPVERGLRLALRWTVRGVMNMTKALVDADVVKQAVYLACRAPSLHNSQPWRWVAQGGVLHLFSDPTRIGRSTDSTGREVIISCGAVLDHLRVAMAAAGWQANVDQFPNPNDPSHLASIDFSPVEFVTDAHRARAEAIRRRRTDRLPFASPPDWDAFEPVLRGTSTPISRCSTSSPRAPGPYWRTRPGSPKNCGDTTRHITPNFNGGQRIPSADSAECARVRDRGSATGREPAFSGKRAGHTAGRNRPGSLEGSGAIHLRRQPSCALESGEALSTVLLESTMAGLATCTLTHMIEVTPAREIVRRLTGKHGMPQVLIRVGKAPENETPPPTTPRRPLTNVLEIRP